MENMNMADSKTNDIVKIEKLILASKNNDRYAFVQLCDIYSALISSIAKVFSVSSNDFDDLFQEGRIALYRAVCSYDGTKASFTTFATVCIRNALTSYIRSCQNRDKLCDYSVSFDDEVTENILISGENSPENVLIETEFFANLEEIISTKLSEYEASVLRLKLSGMSADEIAKKLNKDKKHIENSLFRARKKLKAFLSEK